MKIGKDLTEQFKCNFFSMKTILSFIGHNRIYFIYSVQKTKFFFNGFYFTFILEIGLQKGKTFNTSSTFIS